MRALFIRCAVAGLLITALLSCKPAAMDSPSVTPDEGPAPAGGIARHALLICIDTVRADRFFSPLHDDALTPWLSQSQVYTNASSVSSWTIPAVASVFTGWFPGQHGAGEFKSPVANLEQNLPQVLSQSANTLAEVLKQEGFITGAFSGHSWLEAGSGLEQGFGQIHSRKGRQQVVEQFAQWLDRWQKKRAFGYLHFMEAHDWHLRPRKELLARLSEISPSLRDELLQDATPQACSDPDSTICLRNLVYLLGVRDSRQAIAEVLGLMQARGLLDETAVLVFSDHGEEFWEHKEEHIQRGDPRGEKAFRGEYGFGHGHSLYQEMLHVPLLTWLPGVPGADQTQPVSLVDVMPSIISWLGVKEPSTELPGRLLPGVSGSSVDTWSERVIYASGLAYGPQAVAARQQNQKAIHYLPLNEIEYFDLNQDPLETRSQGSAAQIMAFDVLVGDYLDLPNALPRASGTVDADHLKKLQAIGYLQGVEVETESGED